MHVPTFLGSDRLSGADAVAAILLLEDGRYVMQLRDDIPGIFYPDHWGCFGGAVNPGEDPSRALRRELAEELELQVDAASEFTRFDFDFSPLGQGSIYRIYYEVRITPRAFSRMVLHEGAEMRAFTAVEILQQPRVTPYDAFALWMHVKHLQLA